MARKSLVIAISLMLILVLAFAVPKLFTGNQVRTAGLGEAEQGLGVSGDSGGDIQASEGCEGNCGACASQDSCDATSGCAWHATSGSCINRGEAAPGGDDGISGGDIQAKEGACGDEGAGCPPSCCKGLSCIDSDPTDGEFRGACSSPGAIPEGVESFCDKVKEGLFECFLSKSDSSVAGVIDGHEITVHAEFISGSVQFEAWNAEQIGKTQLLKIEGGDVLQASFGQLWILVDFISDDGVNFVLTNDKSISKEFVSCEKGGRMLPIGFRSVFAKQFCSSSGEWEPMLSGGKPASASYMCESGKFDSAGLCTSRKGFFERFFEKLGLGGKGDDVLQEPCDPKNPNSKCEECTDKESCDANGCAWGDAVGCYPTEGALGGEGGIGGGGVQARIQSCGDITTKTLCDSLTFGPYCKWNAGAGKCEDRGTGIPPDPAEGALGGEEVV